MEKVKRILKRIFCLPPLPTVLAALFGFGLMIAVFVLNIQNPAVQYVSYLASAYALTVTVAGVVHIFTAAGGVGKFVSEHPLMQKFRSTPLGDKLITDVRFRSRVALCAGLTMNLGYIALKLVSA